MTEDKRNDQPVNWPQATRDFLIAALDKGQIVPVLIVLAALVIFYLVPTDKRTELLFTFIHPWTYWPWFWFGVACFTGLCWLIQRRKYQQMMQGELARMAKERDYWQGIAFDARNSQQRMADALAATVGSPQVVPLVVPERDANNPTARIVSTLETTQRAPLINDSAPLLPFDKNTRSDPTS